VYRPISIAQCTNSVAISYAQVLLEFAFLSKCSPPSVWMIAPKGGDCSGMAIALSIPYPAIGLSPHSPRVSHSPIANPRLVLFLPLWHIRLLIMRFYATTINFRCRCSRPSPLRPSPTPSPQIYTIYPPIQWFPPSNPHSVAGCPALITRPLQLA